jgi:hypothetical protein
LNALLPCIWLLAGICRRRIDGSWYSMPIHSTSSPTFSQRSFV